MDISRQIAEALPSELTKEFHEELRTGWGMKKVKAAHDLKWAAKANHKGDARTVEGMGQLMARIPPESYYFWCIKLGPDCWKDKGFLREFLRDNPECIVKSTSKTQVLVDKKITDEHGKPL